MNNTEKTPLIGVICGIIAYILWGVLPIYWKLAANVPSIEILAYRIIWSFVFMVFLVVCLRKSRSVFGEAVAVLRKPKTFLAITAAAVLITVNWFIFIFSVNSGHVTEASLGYYINPLVNILLATVFLKERLNRSETIAVVAAFIGVVILTIHVGQMPWAALGMAVTFSLYGLIKKFVPVSTWAGLTLETLIITPFALIFVIFFSKDGFLAFPIETNFILVGAGVVTAIPLLLFATAAKTINYTLLGFLQYIGPTIMLALGVLLYNEKFDTTQLVAFIFIWFALIIFTSSHIILARKSRQTR